MSQMHRPHPYISSLNRKILSALCPKINHMKPTGQAKAPTEAVDNGVEGLGCRGREVEESLVHFTLDLENKPEIM